MPPFHLRILNPVTQMSGVKNRTEQVDYYPFFKFDLYAVSLGDHIKAF